MAKQTGAVIIQGSRDWLGSQPGGVVVNNSVIEEIVRAGVAAIARDETGEIKPMITISIQ